MQKQPKVYVVVLNYNNKRTLLDCLKALYQSNYPNFEVILVDNNSTDGSLEDAKQAFQRAHIIKNSQNIGFGAGNNVAIRFALEKFADYVFLLNSDAYVERNTISLLVENAEKSEKKGISSPLIYKGKNTNDIWFAHGKIIWSKMKAIHVKNPISDKPYDSQYITGCAMLVFKDVFKKIGLFDEKFFLYYEDADFSLRAVKAGFPCKIEPSAKVIHDENSENNLNQKTYWLVLSGIIFFKKHSPILLKPWIYIYLSLRKLKNLVDIILRGNELARSVRKAYQDYETYSKRTQF